MLTQSRDMKMQAAPGTNHADSHLHAQLELLSKHTTTTPNTNAIASTTTVPNRGAHSQSPQSTPVKPSHGYGNGSTFQNPDVLPPIVNNQADPESHIHPELRAQSTTLAPVVNMMPAGLPPPSVTSGSPAGPSTSLPTHPAVGTMAVDDSIDGRKAKRELSQSKRAAQNRAAQRAFRQRKEGYIKKLEQQVRDYMEMEHNYKTMQSENYAMREYVIHLQSRLLDAQGEFPQPPPNINLSQPPPPPPATGAASEVAASNPAAGTPLEAVAQAVAGLAAQEQLAERQQYTAQGFKPDSAKDEAARTSEEIDRQLRTDVLPAPTASM